MQRDQFIPAKQLNLLAAGWIQFNLHDWFDHGPVDRSRRIKIDLDKDDPVYKVHHGEMLIPRTKQDNCHSPSVILLRVLFRAVLTECRFNKTKVILWPITGDTNNAVNGSKLEANLAGVKRGKRPRASHDWLCFALVLVLLRTYCENHFNNYDNTLTCDNSFPKLYGKYLLLNSADSSNVHFERSLQSVLIS